MLMLLTEYLTQYYSGFNVFGYQTTRAIMGALTALTLSFALGPSLISWLSRGNIGQPIRQLGPESQRLRAGVRCGARRGQPGVAGHRSAARSSAQDRVTSTAQNPLHGIADPATTGAQAGSPPW